LKVLIETRGEGGYVIAPGSPDGCHPLTKPYERLDGQLTDIPTITGEERELLLNAARALNEYVEPKRVISGDSDASSDRPGDDFNTRASWEEILEPHGWEKAGERGDVTDWRRPGKEIGISATTNHAGTDLFYNFSTNGHPFEAGTVYTKFAAYTFLEHGEDFSAAASQLATEGYGTGDHGWPDYSDLPLLLPKAPPLEPDLLPEALRDWTTDVAERMQVPLEMVAVPLVIGLASVVGRRLGIHPKRHDDWLVVPNLYGAVIARPGMLKTPALTQALRPIEILSQKATKEHRKSMTEYDATQAVREVQVKVIKDQMRKVAQGKSKNSLDTLKNELVELQAGVTADLPVERRYKTNDPTVEKLAELMEENPRGLLLTRDELSGWLRTLEKFGREGDREFYMEAWNGTGSFTVDRIGRGTRHIPALCLSMVGGIQPGKLESYVAEAIQGGWGDDGLLQRLQLLVYPETPPRWRNVDRKPNVEAFDRAFKVYQRLDKLNPMSVGAEVDLSDSNPVGALRFSTEAQDFFDRWLGKLQNRLLSGEIESPAFESHLAKYRSLMPSLALLFHLVDRTDGEAQPWHSNNGPVLHDRDGGFQTEEGSSNDMEGDPVSLNAAEKAADWCELLEAHARKVYAGAIRPDLQAAHALKAKIGRGKIKDGHTVREISRSQWSFLTTTQLVRGGLDILQECGWLKVETIPTEGRSSDVVRLNPNLKGIGK
ncbi:MAG: YfjI family protein, partial [Acidobacteriota bacterium]